MITTEIDSHIQNYPPKAQKTALAIRRIVHACADTNGLGGVTESLKWGEPSFSVSGGSPFRMDWKEQTPNTFQLYFNCRTSLVPTFRELYGASLNFEGTRAIVLDINPPLPKDILVHCINLAMNYHSLKHLPLLGA